MQPSGCARPLRAVRKHIYGVLAAACCFCATAVAAPYLPTTADAVVATIPSADMRARGARALQRVARQRPQDLGLAVQAAEASLALSLAESDPRYAGHAEAALAPWWNQPDPPVQVRLLRASILQGRHEFDRARADLDAVITHEGNAQALLTRAVIHQVQGHFDQGRNDCDQLKASHPGLAAETCIALIDSLTGRGAQSLESLSRAVDAGRRRETPQMLLWAYTVLAEIAERLGQPPVAEGYFRAALDLGVKDGYLTGAYADFLLAQNRPREVVDMLKDMTAIDPFLLRLAEAERQLGMEIWKTHTEDLTQRFAAAAARGDVVHRREEARFALRLRDDAKAALALARANWDVQREPADALVLLEAARAVDPAAAQPMRDWIARNRLEDVRLAANKS